MFQVNLQNASVEVGERTLLEWSVSPVGVLSCHIGGGGCDDQPRLSLALLHQRPSALSGVVGRGSWSRRTLGWLSRSF